ncbi:hypothetical protein COB52_01135 [Candidatus Kaiserbacteria bacterium]|nr:MAG: hypothetical protein COB52_01135 [Candidatus Kaiserbacteria bacterium]
MKYKERLKVWIFPGESATWHFVGLNKKETKKIREKFKEFRRGFGSLPVEAKIGETKWKTSIFYSKESEQYILPLKAEVRRKEFIRPGEMIDLELKICP